MLTYENLQTSSEMSLISKMCLKHCKTIYITKNIPEAINKRLSEISFDKGSFDKAAPLYQHAMNESGYNYLTAQRSTQQQKEEPAQKHHMVPSPN